MTDAEVDALYHAADAEFNANEQAMLIAPLAVLGLVEALRSCQDKLAAIERYDELR